MTTFPFKERYANHKTSFNIYNHSSDTNFASMFGVWSKVEEITACIKCIILKRAVAYTPGGKRSGLCLEEVMCTLKAKGNNFMRSAVIRKNLAVRANSNRWSKTSLRVSDQPSATKINWSCINCTKIVLNKAWNLSSNNLF
jgi:hypothetical protein